MAKYEITDDKRVLKILDLDDWRFLTKDHFMALFSMLDKMDPETKAFVQKQMVKAAADSLKKQQDATTKVIEQNGEIGKKMLDVSKETIKALDNIALSGLPVDQQEKMADLVMKVHEDALKEADESRKSNNKALYVLAVTTAIAASVAVTCLNGKVDISKLGKMIKKIR